MHRIKFNILSVHQSIKLQEQWLELHASVDYNALLFKNIMWIILFDYTDGLHISWLWARWTVTDWPHHHTWSGYAPDLSYKITYIKIYLYNIDRQSREHLRCSSSVWENTRTSSMYTETNCCPPTGLRPISTACINLWKTADALVSPNVTFSSQMDSIRCLQFIN